MGRKAKLKKIRQQSKDSPKPAKKYEQTKFVEQFEQMGYQLQIDPKIQPKNNRGNISPEIPQDKGASPQI